MTVAAVERGSRVQRRSNGGRRDGQMGGCKMVCRKKARDRLLWKIRDGKKVKAASRKLEEVVRIWICKLNTYKA